MNTNILIREEYRTELVPENLQYAVLLPDGYEETAETFPVLYVFHGGGENRDILEQKRLLSESLWRKGTLPPCVIVAPSALRSQYMDYKDGSQQWETCLRGPFWAFLHKTYNIRDHPRENVILGVSMGGLGALRMGCKYPDLFGGVAAIAPGIMPSYTWNAEIQHRNLYWRSNEMEEALYGTPIDTEYRRKNNPASIVIENAEKIRAAKFAIYLECGDQNTLPLFKGTEFLHHSA